MLSQILHTRRRFGWRPLLCLLLSEPPAIDTVRKYLDCIVPYECWNNRYRQELEKNLDHRFDILPKTRFCNFLYSNLAGWERSVRMDFCKKLMEHRQVDCPGKNLNNMPPIRRYRFPVEEGIKAKLDFLASYKFTIAFENASVPGYISKKIFHPLSVGSIPIYWGCPEIAQYINPNSFINCHDFSSFDDVIQEVLRIDSDQQLYESYLRAPPILSGTRFEMDREETAKAMRDLLETALLRRSDYRENKLQSFCRLLKTAADAAEIKLRTQCRRRLRKVVANAITLSGAAHCTRPPPQSLKTGTNPSAERPARISPSMLAWAKLADQGHFMRQSLAKTHTGEELRCLGPVIASPGTAGRFAERQGVVWGSFGVCCNPTLS